MEGLHKSRIGRRFAVVLVLGCLGLASGAPASASVTIGQVPDGPPPALTCPAGDYLQPSVTGGNLYIAKQAGTITSWSTFSRGPGTYVFKVFRRTSDPDFFQVVAHAEAEALSSGLLTFPTGIAVRSGDMIGFHTPANPAGSCAFTATGDATLRSPGDIQDGSAGLFSNPIPDHRLNLAATLAPSNEFHVTQLSSSRHGTATMIVQVSNPGVFTLSGKGLKRRQVSRNVAGAGPLTFQLAAGGGPKRKLQRKGRITVGVHLAYAPTNGDPSAQTVPVGLRTRLAKASRSAPTPN